MICAPRGLLAAVGFGTQVCLPCRVKRTAKALACVGQHRDVMYMSRCVHSVAVPS